ncbi:hypothetical protein KAS42_05130 [bacterium]|nr:hypothetical protein [bacterium]
MDKKVLEITSLHDKCPNYWRKKTYLERIAAVEQLRQIIFNYDPSTTRMQKTITVLDLKKGKQQISRFSRY